MAPVLTIRGARKSLGGHAILKGVDLDLHNGRVSAILGPSGAGKSTLLRVIAGLEKLDAGEVRAGAERWDGDGQFLTADKRRVGVVFQDYALFPHLTVERNIAFGLKGKHPAEDIRDRVVSLMKSTEIESLATKFPHELSGGEQQRVALARALAPEPDIVLLDEPFSSLDRRLRSDLRQQTMSAIRKANAAALLVTHDADEAFESADELALMEDGQIIQCGPPAEVYTRPASLTGARLLGDTNMLESKVAGSQIATPFGNIAAAGMDEGKPVRVLFRPEALETSDSGTEFVIESSFIRQGRQRLRVQRPDGSVWLADLPMSRPTKKGETIRLALDPDAVTVLPV
jgi:iron(III) transport system ATP-binding protein